ncbi:MAG TPA: sugar ABC transporter permease [Chloroflexota bacterium]|nr:sugar ABC transporter permease [Chloroflexota bacterium]
MQAIQTPSPRRGAGRRTRPWREARRLLPIYALILPGMALFAVWTIYPLLDALVMSFFDWNPNPAASSTFLGWDNYTKAFGDPIFWQAFGNVIQYTVVTVPGQMVLGLAVALLLDRKLPARGLFRVLYYLPVITSWVVVSFIFAYLFSSQGGLVNWLLGDNLHIIPDTTTWLGSTSLALPTLMILGIWKGVGWNMVIFLAGLQSIPNELYEVASVDGAGPYGRFRYLTLPLLRPVVAFVTVMLVIGAFGAFIPMFILTQGGPEHSTETLMTYGYDNAFSSFDFGYGAAITYIFTAFVFALSVVQLKLLRTKIEY